jgi:hypothetical protein
MTSRIHQPEPGPASAGHDAATRSATPPVREPQAALGGRDRVAGEPPRDFSFASIGVVASDYLGVQRQALPGAPPVPAATGTLLVDDEAAAVGPGQLRRSELMAQIRSAVRTSVDRALTAAGRDTEGCPYLDHWLDYYQRRPAHQLERAVRHYAPEAVSAAAASQYVNAVANRAGRAAERWARTGELSGVPDDLPAVAGRGGEPAAGAIGIGGLFFQAREGGAASRGAPPLAAGQPLDPSIRSRMEPAFGHDFSRVRIHADDGAARTAADLHAHAFTYGTSIAFGAGKYQPGTPAGDVLLAHELAHVVQQSGVSPPPGPALAASTESAALEQAADDAAAHVVGELHAPPTTDESPRARRPRGAKARGLSLQRCKDHSTPAPGPTVPRTETQPYGVYQIVADSTPSPRGATVLTQAEFVRLAQAWTRVNDNSGGLTINGSTADKATMIAMLAREMGRSRTFRDLIIEITEDRSHPVIINAGRDNAFALDEFGNNNSDLNDLEFLDVDAPAGYTWAWTQGEDIVHWLAERRYAALNSGTAFLPAHADALRAGGAQERYRTDRGQSGRIVAQTATTSPGLFEGHSVDNAGNRTIFKMDTSGAVPVPYELEYRPASPTAAAPGMSRLSQMEAEVHSSAASAEPLFVRFTSATATVSTPDQSVGAANRTYATPLRGVVPTNGPITVEVLRRGNGGAADVVVVTFSWTNPFGDQTTSAMVGGVRYDVSLRRVRR